jgi:hypothetical protein
MQIEISNKISHFTMKNCYTALAIMRNQNSLTKLKAKPTIVVKYELNFMHSLKSKGKK